MAVLFLTAWSVVGDLFESLIKRAAGAKGQQPAPAGDTAACSIALMPLLPVCPLALGLLV